MESRYRVDLAVFDPPEGEDEEPAVVCQMTAHGASLEGAIANAIVAMAPHIIHMGYEFMVVGAGVFCDVHGCYHEIRNVLGHAAEQPEVVFEGPPEPAVN